MGSVGKRIALSNVPPFFRASSFHSSRCACRFSGAAVTHWGTVIEVSSTIGAGVYVQQATGHETPEKFFPGFLVCFLLLFMSTGSSNGSTFRQMSGSKFCEPCYIDDRLQLHSEPIPDTPAFFVSIRLRVWLAGWRKRSMLFEPGKA